MDNRAQSHEATKKMTPEFLPGLAEKVQQGGVVSPYTPMQTYLISI